MKLKTSLIAFASIVILITSCKSMGGPSEMVKSGYKENLSKVEQSSVVIDSKNKKELKKYWEIEYGYDKSGQVILYIERYYPIYKHEFNKGKIEKVWKWDYIGGNKLPKSYEYFEESYGSEPKIAYYYQFSTLNGLNAADDVYNKTDLSWLSRKVNYKKSLLFIFNSYWQEPLDISRFDIEKGGFVEEDNEGFGIDGKYVLENKVTKWKSIVNLDYGYGNIVLKNFTYKNRGTVKQEVNLNWEAINGLPCLKKYSFIDNPINKYYISAEINADYDAKGRRTYEKWEYSDKKGVDKKVIFEQKISYTN